MIIASNNDTICAPATPNRNSALGIVRISGQEAISIADKLFVDTKNQNKVLAKQKSSIAKHGFVIDANGEKLDEVICTIFKAPNTFTGEDLVEITHHGSPYIQQQIIKSLIDNGARIANNGEFSQRAFLNGKMDLSQAEAVADLISAKTAISHKLAMQQLHGGYKDKIAQLRAELVRLLSLLELELDFSEEDVEFADRTQLKDILHTTILELQKLVKSFAAGENFKNGIPIAIVGKPNSGKSTLMNAILNEERSIVSPVKGTTRDTIEESIQLEGVEYRFIDTAGIRSAKGMIESIGIERSYKAIEKAEVLLYVCDLAKTSPSDAQLELLKLDEQVSLSGKKIIIIGNKVDLVHLSQYKRNKWGAMNTIYISAATGFGLESLLSRISHMSQIHELHDEILVTNTRHYNIMMKTLAALLVAEESIECGQPTDIVVADIRESIHYIGEITGEITTDEVLTNIFSKFCIGK